jgi:Flp pilus assembly protein TadG
MKLRRERGFVLIATTIVLVILLGLAAVVVDAGRMYVIKSELQAFTDAASLNAAMQLDGSPAGLEKARKAAAELAEGDHAMKWDFGTRPITGFQFNFDQPGQVRVVVSVPAPIIFFKALGAVQSDGATVSAASLAASAPPRLLQ